MQSTLGRRYGWHPHVPDIRDHLYLKTHHKDEQLTTLPPEAGVDGSACMPAVNNQLTVGCCTAEASTEHYQFERSATGGSPFTPSVLDQYWNERKLAGTTGYDSGATTQEACQALVSAGVGPDALWPFQPAKVLIKPPALEREAQAANKAKDFSGLVGINQMKNCLASGHPFIIGFSVYQSFETAAVAATGLVPWPQPGEGLLGGHAVLITYYWDSFPREGFLKDKPVLKVRNSWGADWGDGGNFYINAAYFTDPRLASGAKTLRL